MIRALYTAASGMNAQQANIDNVAHNLANVNTTGFKKSRVEFEDLLSETIRSAAPPSAEGGGGGARLRDPPPRGHLGDHRPADDGAARIPARRRRRADRSGLTLTGIRSARSAGAMSGSRSANIGAKSGVVSPWAAASRSADVLSRARRASRARATDADLWPLVLAVPTREQQALARECLGEVLARTENSTLPAAVRFDDCGTVARLERTSFAERRPALAELLTDPQAWTALLTLTLLEIVLGVDNVIFISILAGKLPLEKQNRARVVGLSLAMFMRIALLFSISWVIGLTGTLFSVFDFDISGRDLILIGGGLFLLGKATFEIHE